MKETQEERRVEWPPPREQPEREPSHPGVRLSKRELERVRELKAERWR